MNKFNVLKFIADNSGLSLPDALEKAYEQGANDLRDKIINQIQSYLDGVNITLDVLQENDGLIPRMEGAKTTLEECLSIVKEGEKKE